MQRFSTRARLVANVLRKLNTSLQSQFNTILLGMLSRLIYSFCAPYYSFLTVVCFIFLVMSQTACIFEQNPTEISLFTVDTVGMSRGELGYVADGKVYTLNPAGGGAVNQNVTGVAKRFRFRADLNQFVYILDTNLPQVQNRGVNDALPVLNTADYQSPLSFEYKGSLLYFLRPQTQRIVSPEAAFNQQINARIDALVSSTDSVKYLTISTTNDLALITRNAVTKNYRAIWSKQNGTSRSYNSVSALKQPRFSKNGSLLVVPSSDGIFSWNDSESQPKKVIFKENILTFAVNPIGTEIAYITHTGIDTVYVHNLQTIKGHRKLTTLPQGKKIVDIDWK